MNKKLEDLDNKEIIEILKESKMKQDEKNKQDLEIWKEACNRAKLDGLEIYEGIESITDSHGNEYIKPYNLK